MDEFGRRTGHVDPTALDGGSVEVTSPVTMVEDPQDENVVLSLVASDLAPMHRPVLDLDFPCRLIPSSTEGHFHLYLDGVQIQHDDYMELVAILKTCGILGDGYADHSIQRGYTVVRRPGSYKKGSGMTYQPKHMKRVSVLEMF